MVRIPHTVLYGTVLACAVVGCANLAEMGALDHFTAAIEKNDLNQLKASASETFDEKALRRKDSIDALKIAYQHPEEKLTILKVKSVSDKEKKVEVTTEKTHRKMEFKLVRDAKTGKWVVDDIVIKQKKGDVTAVKSVTEQMDLLLVVQDFLVAWHKGKREEVQAVTTASFGKLLGELPTTHLERLTKRVAGERIKSEEFRPEATIDGQDAIVKLQRARGILILSMRLTNKGWKVSDVQVESRKDKDQLASAKRTATVIRTVVDFLKAYKAADSQELKKLSAETFYEKCLVLADPKLVPLPAPDVLGEKDVVTTEAKTGEYLLKRGDDTVKISLKSTSTDPDSPKFVIDEVTIFDAKSQKRLAALFTAQAKMQLFVQAMLKGNLALVRANSSKDFDLKVWNRLKTLPLTEILPPEIEMAAAVNTDPTDFRGPVIRIPVRQGNRELTYVMRDWNGDVAVDDVLMPVLDRPQSLKDTLQVLLPIRLLTAALRDSSLATEGQDPQLESLRTISSRNFNRLVWSQITQIPEAAYAVLPHLDMPLSSITESSTGQVVQLGDERFGAKIELVREGELLMIDRIWLQAGQSDPPELRHSLQLQLAKRGPRGFAADPLSAHPISTDPSRTASTTSAETAPLEMPEADATPRGRASSSVILPTVAEPAKRATLAQPLDLR
ncbi:MAG TPA: hypothetical protein VFG04_19960 [Planctomycetaceae bacterium]|jgi:hypothetical protein|nr:hypothetical protein [Planctomycetaceae bacterium]